MKLKMYSIWDKKAAVYNTPFFQRTHGEAERSFQQIATDNKSTVSLYPSDFDLYCIGEYDDNTGLTEPMTPQHMLNAQTAAGPTMAPPRALNDNQPTALNS